MCRRLLSTWELLSVPKLRPCPCQVAISGLPLPGLELVPQPAANAILYSQRQSQTCKVHTAFDGNAYRHKLNTRKILQKSYFSCGSLCRERFARFLLLMTEMDLPIAHSVLVETINVKEQAGGTPPGLTPQESLNDSTRQAALPIHFPKLKTHRTTHPFSTVS